VDIFSYAVTLWELQSLEIPWKEVAFSTEIEKKVINGERLALSPAWRPEISAIIIRCWDQDPSNRPSWDWVKTALKELKPPSRNISPNFSPKRTRVRRSRYQPSEDEGQDASSDKLSSLIPRTSPDPPDKLSYRTQRRSEGEGSLLHGRITKRPFEELERAASLAEKLSSSRRDGALSPPSLPSRKTEDITATLRILRPDEPDKSDKLRTSQSDTAGDRLNPNRNLGGSGELGLSSRVSKKPSEDFERISLDKLGSTRQKGSEERRRTTENEGGLSPRFSRVSKKPSEDFERPGDKFGSIRQKGSGDGTSRQKGSEEGRSARKSEEFSDKLRISRPDDDKLPKTPAGSGELLFFKTRGKDDKTNPKS